MSRRGWRRSTFFAGLAAAGFGVAMIRRSDLAAVRSGLERARCLLRRRANGPGGRRAADSAFPHVRFEWVLRDSDLVAVTVALDSEQIPFVVRGAATGRARNEILAYKLIAVGMQLDQEPPTLEDGALVRVSGFATGAQLTAGIDAALAATISGIIVDTTALVMEIDQHSDLGPGELVLLEPTGARQLRAGTRRALAEAVHDAIARRVPLEFRPLADRAQLRHELTDFPATVDELIADLRKPAVAAGHLSYERAERLGALRRCDRCGTAIVEVGARSGLVAEFYESPSRRQDIADALVQSGLEVGDPLSPNFCSAHGEITPTSNQ